MLLRSRIYDPEGGIHSAPTRKLDEVRHGTKGRHQHSGGRDAGRDFRRLSDRHDLFGRGLVQLRSPDRARFDVGQHGRSDRHQHARASGAGNQETGRKSDLHRERNASGRSGRRQGAVEDEAAGLGRGRVYPPTISAKGSKMGGRLLLLHFHGDRLLHFW